MNRSQFIVNRGCLAGLVTGLFFHCNKPTPTVPSTAQTTVDVVIARDTNTNTVTARLDATAPNTMDARSVAVPPRLVAQNRQNTLVMYQHGIEVGREVARDDGNILRSELTNSGRSATLEIDRTQRKYRMTFNGQTLERDILENTLVVFNGQWQSYALALEWFPQATTPTAIYAQVGLQARIPATLTIQNGDAGGRRVNLFVAPNLVTVEVNPDGIVTRATVANQGIEALPEGVQSTAGSRPVPPGIHEETVTIAQSDVTLRGVLWTPENVQGPMPVAVLIAGSGPTDRDGNQLPLLNTDLYRLIAMRLAENGIATLRMDKRGVGQSIGTFNPVNTVFDDFANDVVQQVNRLRGDQRFSRVSLIGHSEGVVVAVSVAQRTNIDGLALLSGPGRTMGSLIRAQLVERGGGEPAGLEWDQAIAHLRANEPVGTLSPTLRTILPSVVHNFIRSEADVDPVALFHSTHCPAVIIQGGMDVQVSEQDARNLGAARPEVNVVILPTANHVFRAETERTTGQASYRNPALPLVDGLIEPMLPVLRVQTH